MKKPLKNKKIDVTEKMAAYDAAMARIRQKEQLSNPKKLTVTHHALRWLGMANTKLIVSHFDYITHGKEGINRAAVYKLADYLGVTRKFMAEDILAMSVKTLERKAGTEKLNKNTSSHAIEIAQIMKHALEVFGTDEKVKSWVNTPNKALKGFKPVELMDTLTGLQLIDDVLGRIQEGVFS